MRFESAAVRMNNKFAENILLSIAPVYCALE